MTFTDALAMAGILVLAFGALIGWILFSAYAWTEETWAIRILNFAGWILIVAVAIYFMGQTEAAG